jgi:hypothetical protein
MSFTYDLSTDTGKMRLLLGDTASATANWQDEELQAFLDNSVVQLSGPRVNNNFSTPISGSESILYACAQACDSKASQIAMSAAGRTVKIGDYQLTGSSQVKAIQDLGQRFRDAIDNTPAWGIAEENLTQMNQLIIIRNWVFRTEV